MNGKIKLLLGVTALAVLIGGSYFLYDTLVEGGYDGSQLIIFDNEDDKAPEDVEKQDDENSVPVDIPEEKPSVDIDDEVDAPTTEEPEATDDSPTDEIPDEPTDEEPTEEINLAPDFLVYDKDGVAKRLSDYFGKPIVLNFWASWCIHADARCLTSKMPTSNTAMTWNSLWSILPQALVRALSRQVNL